MYKDFFSKGISKFVVEKETSFTPRGIQTSSILQRSYSKDDLPDKTSDAHNELMKWIDNDN